MQQSQLNLKKYRDMDRQVRDHDHRIDNNPFDPTDFQSFLVITSCCCKLLITSYSRSVTSLFLDFNSE